MGKKLIVTPREFAQRGDPQAALVDINRRLVRELDVRRQQVVERDVVIKAMNQVFTNLAEKIGTPVPTNKENGPAALEAMFQRIDMLVVGEAEKTAVDELLSEGIISRKEAEEGG